MPRKTTPSLAVTRAVIDRKVGRARRHTIRSAHSATCLFCTRNHLCLRIAWQPLEDMKKDLHARACFAVWQWRMLSLLSRLLLQRTSNVRAAAGVLTPAASKRTFNAGYRSSWELFLSAKSTQESRQVLIRSTYLNKPIIRAFSSSSSGKDSLLPYNHCWLQPLQSCNVDVFFTWM